MENPALHVRSLFGATALFERAGDWDLESRPGIIYK
jgi:hypothetical protein